MALGERILNASFGDDLVDHFTYVFLGDGCFDGGNQSGSDIACGSPQAWSPDSVLGQQLHLDRWATSLSVSDNEPERFRASGWHVLEIDGHDTDAIRDAITTLARKLTSLR